MVAMRERKQHKAVGPGNDYISSEAVAHILGCSIEWVRKLRENGRLQAWKMKDDGTGWELLKHVEGNKRQGKAATGGRVLFAKSEVEEYMRNHTPQPHKEPAEVSPQEEAFIAHFAYDELQNVGYVTRAHLAKTIYNAEPAIWQEYELVKPGYRKLQDKIKTVADRNKWPYPPTVRKHQE